MASATGYAPDEALRDEEVFVPELPPESIGQEERRMQLRTYGHWANLRRTHAFPLIADLRMEELTALAGSDFPGHAVLLDFSGGMENPSIGFLGEDLARECGEAGAIRRLSDIPGTSLLSRIAEHYVQILAYQAPIGFEAEFLNREHRTMLYRGILLPYGDADGVISHVLGVINWKELVDTDMAVSLLREIRQSYRPEAYGVQGASPALFSLPALPHAELPQLSPAGAAPQDCEAPSLHEWLISARSLARAARRRRRAEGELTHTALYAAIGGAWDFALAAQDARADYARLLAEANLKPQARAPLLPLVKLVFGPSFDKTRLTEYATVLAHAKRHGIARGALAGWLAAFPGGLKGVVHEERRARLLSPPASRLHPRLDALATRLRRLRARPLASLDPVGEEFAVLLARRLGNGEVVLLGEVASDNALLERVARHLPV